MKTELKNYINLYIGCEVIMESMPECAEPNIAKLTSVSLDHCAVTYPNERQEFLRDFSAVKLSLRPLSSIQPEEIKELEIELDWRSLTYTNVKTTMFTPDEFTYLCSKGFDLFGLIENGLAIEKINRK